MQKVVNYIRGTVRLELTGAFPERFLNLCAVENLPFWGAEQMDAHRLRVTLAALDRGRAEALAQRAMCQTEELGRFGLPAFLLRFRKRYALLAGLALSLLALCILSNFVLIIHVTGNHRISDREILGTLERLGLRVGVYAPSVNERELVNRALLELEDIGFLTVNIRGIRAEVVVREAPHKPEIMNPDRPADVIAARDGFVLSVDTRAGEEQVRPGDAVLKGEVLISGLVTCEQAETERVLSSRQVRAVGEVWAVTGRTLTDAIPLRAAGKGPVRQTRTGYALRLGRHRINFYRNGSISGGTCDRISRAYKLTLPGGWTLPVAWVKLEYQDREAKRVNLKRKGAERYLKDRLEKRLQRELDGGTVLSRDWTATERDGVLIVSLKADCNEQIGRTLELDGDE